MMKKYLVGKYIDSNALALLILIVTMTSGWTAPVIQKTDSPAGRIDSVRITKSSVEGRIWRITPYHTTPGAHVHVLLINDQDQVIAQGMDRLSIMTPRSDIAHRHSSYKVTFQEEVTHSPFIRVKYVPGSHEKCEHSKVE